MLQKAVALSFALASGSVAAGCPDFLDHDLRKLHSSELVNLCELSAGKPLLVVNTASHCGYTRQFEGLQKLYEKYRDAGLEVVGFASDDFRQEARDEEEAAQVCYVNFGVTFTMIAPTHVRGANANPVFRELAEQTQAPAWNFNKYLVDATGKVVGQFGSSTVPQSPEMEKAIAAVLRQTPGN